jgi:hypothetical protein
MFQAKQVNEILNLVLYHILDPQTPIDFPYHKTLNEPKSESYGVKGVFLRKGNGLLRNNPETLLETRHDN